ncbi:hypothetical protein Dimus_003561, partial [Dionaea muscipula]
MEGGRKRRPVAWQGWLVDVGSGLVEGGGGCRRSRYAAGGDGGELVMMQRRPMASLAEVESRSSHDSSSSRLDSTRRR